MTCNIDGCQNPIKAKGMCEKHYTRMRRYGNLKTKTTERGSIPECLVENCTKPTVSIGYCGYHYKYFKLHGYAYIPKNKR